MEEGESRGVEESRIESGPNERTSTETSLLFTRILASVFGVHRWFVRSKPATIDNTIRRNWNNTVFFFFFLFSTPRRRDRSRFHSAICSIDCPRKNSDHQILEPFFCYFHDYSLLSSHDFFLPWCSIQLLLFGSSRSRQKSDCSADKTFKRYIYIYILEAIRCTKLPREIAFLPTILVKYCPEREPVHVSSDIQMISTMFLQKKEEIRIRLIVD